jgi:threonine/homoserine/homoserine lactone efflux protein
VSEHGQTDRQAQAGRRAALVIAATAALWVLSTMIGAQLGLSNRVLALFDMLALAGFVWAIWMIYNIWRMRQDSQGQ